MQEEARRALAAAIVEAFETGNPIAPLDPALSPPDGAAAEAVAEAVLDALGLAPCGIRLLRGADGTWRAGPMLGPRLLPEGAALSLATLRRPRVSAAAIGVLAEALAPGGDGPPRLSVLHAGLDIAASRFRDGAASGGESIADLADLGFVVAGRAGAPAGDPVAVSCAPEPKRPRGAPARLAEGFAAAAAAARRLGGLPAGALLVLAGLTPASVPAPGEAWTARLAGLGRARARFAPEPRAET